MSRHHIKRFPIVPAVCAVAIAFANGAFAGEGATAGNITFTGDFSGKAAFDTATCTVVSDKLIVFQAPTLKDDENLPDGAAAFQYGVIGSGSSVMFKPPSDAAKHEVFMARHGGQSPAFHIEKTHGTWSVAFDGLKMSDTSFEHRKNIVASGKITCTDTLAM